MPTLMYLLSLILMLFETFSWAFSSGTTSIPSNNYMCYNYGEKSISAVVTFPTAFQKVPTVLISAKSFDLGAEAAIMITYVSSVTTTNFVLTWRTWYKWAICTSEMTWFAYSDQQPRNTINSTTSNSTTNNSMTTNSTAINAINTTAPAIIVPITTSEHLYTFANLNIDAIIIICLVCSVSSLVISLVLCFLFIKGRKKSQSRSEVFSSHNSGFKNGDRKYQESSNKDESIEECSDNSYVPT